MGEPVWNEILIILILGNLIGGIYTPNQRATPTAPTRGDLTWPGLSELTSNRLIPLDNKESLEEPEREDNKQTPAKPDLSP